MTIELLQRIGMNKYEAEAYQALLRHGPLTGYELGKRSGVPLSRSYEILERLVEQGLALVQPGDPPRYLPEAPEQLVARTRAATAATLEALAAALADLAEPRVAQGFWVLRGRAPILNHARTLAAGARSTLVISAALAAELAAELAAARARGCQITSAPQERASGEVALLLLDGREALVGTLAPADACQAVVSANPAFVAALARGVAPRAVMLPSQAEPPARAPGARPLDWLDWEQRKQRGLLAGPRDQHGAPGAR